MAFPVTLNGRTYTLTDFEGTNYVDGLPDAFEDFVTQAGDIYNSTSTTSNSIGTGSKTFTVEANKPYQAGTPLRIADAAAPSTNFLDTVVTSYSGTTLVVNSIGFGGSGTKTSWTVNIGGAKTVDGTLGLSQGGTGATDAAGARTNIDVYSKSEADTRYLNISGDSADISFGANMSFGDNNKAIFGAGSDLSIFHNGSTSLIEDSGTGGITLRSDIFTVQNAAGTETVAQFVQDGFVRLYYNNDPKLVTNATGVSVTGNARFADNGKAIFGAGSELQIFSDGTKSYLIEGGSGNLEIRATDLVVKNADNTKVMASFTDGGATQLRYDSDLKLATTSTGVSITGSLGIGTNSPSEKLSIVGAGNSTSFSNTTASTAYNLATVVGNAGGSVKIGVDNNIGTAFSSGNYGGSIQSTNNLAFSAGGSEAMRIDSGNLLVGKTSLTFNTEGHALAPTFARFTRNGDAPVQFNRTTSDGDIALFYKNGSTVGRIGNNSTRIFIGSGDTNLTFNSTASKYIFPSTADGGGNDNVIDLGISTARFDDIHATNGTIQTSDRNEKQDIEALSDAEERVAVAAKGLMRKFRWKNRVAEKGDEARTHFGIIAQDLQAAFAAEGLDAGDYAMFISTTWWETQTEVPAIEAVAEVLDEDGNVVTEAVEAADAYTRTDTYDTQEEAPEGATERTRLGVRYSELLAFIIAAI